MRWADGQDAVSEAGGDGRLCLALAGAASVSDVMLIEVLKCADESVSAAIVSTNAPTNAPRAVPQPSDQTDPTTGSPSFPISAVSLPNQSGPLSVRCPAGLPSRCRSLRTHVRSDSGWQ